MGQFFWGLPACDSVKGSSDFCTERDNLYDKISQGNDPSAFVIKEGTFFSGYIIKYVGCGFEEVHCMWQNIEMG